MSKIVPYIERQTGMFPDDIARIISNAPMRYKHFTIPKRNGKDRPIDQPAKELKILQKLLVDYLSETCPVHEAATAYKKGASILKNANIHAENDILLKFDFKDFFPSINEKNWAQFCYKNDLFDDVDLYISTNILFMQSFSKIYKVLSIGAPSSPMISNMVMYDFDNIISNLVKNDKVSYSRYADDMIFSAKRIGNLRYVEGQIKETLKECGLSNLKLNHDKTVLSTKKYKRNVTGLIITNDRNISLGRQKKREISVEIHYALNGKKTAEEIESILGKLAFAKSIEPKFYDKMEIKYGPALIHLLKSHIK